MNENVKVNLNGIEVFDDAPYRMDSRFVFSEDEFEKIRRGYTRKSGGGNRWYVVVENDTVFILRSVNPSINFKIPFTNIGDKYVSEISYSAFNPKGKSLEATTKKTNYWNFWIYGLITGLIFNEPWLLTLDTLVHKAKIDFNGLHGFGHWRAVYRTGNSLSTNIDKLVLFFFSVFHDFFRENEYTDPNHGNRAAESCESIYLDLKVRTKDVGKLKLQMEKLAFALKYHDISPDEYARLTNPLKDDKTVQICLDADRLDLGRVGIQPNADYLLSQEARQYIKRFNRGL